MWFFNSLGSLRRRSVELEEVLGVDLVAVEDDVDLGVAHVVHAAVVEVREAGVLGGRPAVHGVSSRVLAHQHARQEHGLEGRLAGEDGRGQAVALQRGVVLPRRQAELTRVFGVPGEVAPWGEMHCGTFVTRRQNIETSTENKKQQQHC